MKAENNYLYADKVIKQVNQRIPLLLNDIRLRLMVFDEVNPLILKELLKQAYNEVENQAIYAYLKIAQRTYAEAFDIAKQFGYKSGTYNPTLLVMITDWLLEYDGVTGYVFYNEITRKRERLFEQLMGSFMNKNDEDVLLTEPILKKASRYLENQITEYGDIVAYKAMEKAYSDAGVEKVIWLSEYDNRVCGECLNLSGKTFLLRDVPLKPHWGCRCWLLPIKTEKS